MNLRPVAYISMTLSKSEWNYTYVERQILAMVFSGEIFKHFFLGHKCTVITNHTLLTRLFAKDTIDTIPRLARILPHISDYDLEIVHQRENTYSSLMHLVDFPVIILLSTTNLKSRSEHHHP